MGLSPRPERRRRLRRGAFGVLAIGSLVGVAACQWLVNLDADGPALTAEAGPPAEPCGAVPPRPAIDASADATADVPRITLAAYYWGYDNGDGGRSDVCKNSALDLDGLNSVNGAGCAPAACTPVGGGSNPAACDGPNGSDDGLAYILTQLNGVLESPTTNLDSFAPTIALQRGVLNLLFDISDYNGSPDDDAIDVAIWTSSGLTGLAQDGGFAYQDIHDLPEVWDGSQADAEWTVDERSVKNLDAGIFLPKVQATGYVKDGILVLPSTGPLDLPPLIGTSVAITDGVLTGHLFRGTDNRWQLTDGRIAARVESAALLGVVGTSKLTGASALCEPGSALYGVLRAEVCQSLDLPAGGGAPDGAATCGALSLSLAIASVESTITSTIDPDNPLRHVAVGKSHLQGTPLCVDDAGTIFCDDCAWTGPRRCPIPGK